jgi:hypothetical protein
MLIHTTLNQIEYPWFGLDSRLGRFEADYRHHHVCMSRKYQSSPRISSHQNLSDNIICMWLNCFMFVVVVVVEIDRQVINHCIDQPLLLSPAWQ